MSDESGESNIAEQTSAPVDVNNQINAAVTAHLRRFAEKQLPTMLEAALKPIQDKLAAPPPPPSDDDAGGKGKQKVSPEMQALQAQLEEFKSKFAAEAQARAAAEKKSRDDKAQSELRSHLQPHVKGDLLDILTDHLFRGKSVVDFEDDGTPVFKSKKVDVFGEEEMRLPLKAGVEQFLKSPEAKPFLPAPGSSSATVMKKPSSPASSGARETDINKMSEREKIAHADRVAAEYSARLGNR